MLASKIRAYEKAVDRRETQFRAYTEVKGDTATRKIRLDEARILIGEIVEFDSTHGLRKFLEDIGEPTTSAAIPDMDDFAANLDQKMMNDAIQSHNAVTDKTAKKAEALSDALKDQDTLDHFDTLPAVDRLELMIRVAELLPIMAGDGHPPQRVTSSGRFFDPVRISAMIDGLPLRMTDDGFELDRSVPKAQGQIEAFGSRHGINITGPNDDTGIEVALSKVASRGQKFLGIFLGPTMQLIDDSNAETALGKALRAFLPPSVIGPAATVDEIAVRLTDPQVHSQFNLGSLQALGAKVGFFLNVLAIGSELQTLSRRSSFDSQAFRSAATAVLKSADGAIAAAQQMGYSLGKRGIRTTAVFVTLPMLLLDGIAAVEGISRSRRKSDLSVAMGEAVKFAGSVLMTVTASYVAATGGVLLSGPAGWAMAVGFALVLLGEFLINATSDVPLTTFSKTCVFTNNTGATLTSDDPAEVQFRFANGDRFDARRQAEKLAAILHDPGFKASFPLIGIEVEYTHEVTVTRPDGSTETVPTVPDGIQVQMHYIGKAGSTTAPQSVPSFSRSRLKENGADILDLDDSLRNQWRGGYFEFLIDLSPALPIRAYAEVP